LRVIVTKAFSYNHRAHQPGDELDLDPKLAAAFRAVGKVRNADAGGTTVEEPKRRGTYRRRDMRADA